MATVPARADFIARFAEFGEIPSEYTGLVDTVLAEAARATNADVYPDAAQAQDAVFLKAAVLLSQSPFARKMRLLGEEQTARYEFELYKKQRAATMGLRCF